MDIRCLPTEYGLHCLIVHKFEQELEVEALQKLNMYVYVQPNLQLGKALPM